MSRPSELSMPNIPVHRVTHLFEIRLLLAVSTLTIAIAVACSGSTPTDPSPTGAAVPPESPPSVASPTASPPTTTVPPGSTSGSTPTVGARQTPEPPATETRDAQESRGAGTDEAVEHFPVPPDRDYYRLARELIPGSKEIDPVVRHTAPTLEEGELRTFNLVDLDAKLLYESDFELRLVTPHAYWFVEDGVRATKEEIERSASEFEDNIYPKVTGTFGREWNPGVDGDPHLYIINANLRGVGGYFSAADEYPRSIRPVSNEIEAIYTNARYLPIGTDIFSQVLAHELQHAVHWNLDLSEETWVNEGLSELAASIAGYPEISIHEFRRAGPASLTMWPADDVGGAENYGAASLFMQYLTEHHGGRDNLRHLLAQSEDGIPGIDAFLVSQGHDVRFDDVFRDWAVANLLDENSGRYGYSDLDIRFPVYENLKAGDELSFATPQYANEYVRLEQLTNAATLSFEGDAVVPLLPEDVGEGCWWSNKGDVIDSTLTASVDLRNAGTASLDYQAWFSIEENWDFAYLEVSVDGSKTWTILETSLTNSEDPLQVSFGPGYTGSSQGWQAESVSLDRWTGQEIMIRFQYITDAAIHDHGLCVRNIRLSGDGTELATEWTPRGFFWTNNLVRQNFIAQVVYEGQGASENRVIQVQLDEKNRTEFTLEPDPDAKRIVAIIQPTAPSTRMPANYTLKLRSAG